MLTLSQKERDRLVHLRLAQQGQISVAEGRAAGRRGAAALPPDAAAVRGDATRGIRSEHLSLLLQALRDSRQRRGVWTAESTWCGRAQTCPTGEPRRRRGRAGALCGGGAGRCWWPATPCTRAGTCSARWPSGWKHVRICTCGCSSTCSARNTDTTRDADLVRRFAARFRSQEWPGTRLPRNVLRSALAAPGPSGARQPARQVRGLGRAGRVRVVGELHPPRRCGTSRPACWSARSGSPRSSPGTSRPRRAAACWCGFRGCDPRGSPGRSRRRAVNAALPRWTRTSTNLLARGRDHVRAVMRFAPDACPD